MKFDHFKGHIKAIYCIYSQVDLFYFGPLLKICQFSHDGIFKKQKKIMQL